MRKTYPKIDYRIDDILYEKLAIDAKEKNISPNQLAKQLLVNYYENLNDVLVDNDIKNNQKRIEDLVRNSQEHNTLVNGNISKMFKQNRAIFERLQETKEQNEKVLHLFDELNKIFANLK